MLNLVELILYLLEIDIVAHILAHTLLWLRVGGIDLHLVIILWLLLGGIILLASVVVGALLLALCLLLHLATHAEELEEHK